MISHKQTPHGRLLADKYLLTDTPQPDMINLMSIKWEKMRYGEEQIVYVDFPWEYDIQEQGIVCFEAWDLLHYQLIIDDQSVVLIQSPALLEKETLSDISTWVCLDEKCKEAIERNELEGEIVVLTPAEEEIVTID